MNNILNENIIKYLGLEKLDEKKQEETLLRIGKVIYQAVMMRVVDLLDEQSQSEFDKLLEEVGQDPKPMVGQDETKQNEVMEFLKAKISNLDEIAKEEIIKFKEETVSVMGNLK